MRYLIVSCVYPPEPVVSAQTSAQIAERLSDASHSVTVVTRFPSRPGGLLFPGISRKFAQREQTSSGIVIVRCFSTVSSRSRMFSRLLENLSFGLNGGWQVLISKGAEVIYANTWPIIATGILFLVAKLRRIPLVISVQDVYPETLVTQQRVASGSATARFMGWVDGIIARHSAHVIVISKRFADIYRSQRRVPPDQLSLVPNWIDADSIDISTSKDQFRLNKGIGPKDFLLVYGGNIGVAAGVETLIESMRHLIDQDNVRLLVAGEGSQLPICKALAREGLRGCVVFHSPWLPEETSEVLRSADVLLLPTQGAQSLVSVPSKLLSYMLAARPVIALAIPGSDIADLIDQSRCGWVVDPNCPDLLAAKIKEVTMLEPAERKRRGDMGRDYALRNFTKEICLPKVIQILEAAGG